MKLSLEFMTIVCADRADTQRGLVDDVIDKFNGIRLRVAAIDFKYAHAGRVINGRRLEAPDLLSTFSPEGQEFNVYRVRWKDG